MKILKSGLLQFWGQCIVLRAIEIKETVQSFVAPSLFLYIIFISAVFKTKKAQKRKTASGAH